MAVVSNTFGGLLLSGEDARKFRRQVSHGRASAAAKESAANGKLSASSLLENGYVKVAKIRV